MPELPIGRDCLALYKTHPAIVQHVGEKLEIALEGGKTLKVRPKDVVVLHPGPATLAELKPQVGDVLAAWELLAGSTTTLAELAELAYARYTPATAWAAWEWVTEGVCFSGTPGSLSAHTAEDVAREQAARGAKAAEASAWIAFLERARTRRVAPEDSRYLNEVADLALGRRDKSRVLAELGRTQSPEHAHAFLLDIGYWDATIDPYPRRLDLATTAPTFDLGDLPEESRVDLTALPAFAIDDEGNQDPDDAVSLDGDRLWVHVADVAALVRPDSPADIEARTRGANLYLPEGAVPMLPIEATRRLGLGLAERSPALSFGIRLNDYGEIADLEVVTSWVRVTRLSYDEADRRLDEMPFRRLHALARFFEARRRRNGAISLDLPEVKIWLEDGQVRIKPLPPLASRSMVLEAMLIAGEAVAQLAFDQRLAMPYTIQDPPDSIDAPPTLAGMFARRRTMSASQQAIAPAAHAGLGLPRYVRTTSPLRRYLDLVAHQQVRAWLTGQPVLDEQQVLERLGAAEAVTGTVRRAEQLARQHWTIVYLMQHPGWRGQGVLVDKAGLRGTLLLPELAWETRVHLRNELALDSVLPVMASGVNLPFLEAYFQTF
jgi:exoribonuclease-2